MNHLDPSNNLPLGALQPASAPGANDLNTPFTTGGNLSPAAAEGFSSPWRFATRFDWAALREQLASSVGLDHCRVRAVIKGESEGTSLAIIAEENLRFNGLPRLWGGQLYKSHFALVSFSDLDPDHAREIFSWDAEGGSHKSKAAIASGVSKVAYILNEPGHQNEIAVITFDRDAKSIVSTDKVNLAQLALWDTAQHKLETIALSPDGKYLWAQNSNNEVACIRLSGLTPEAVRFRGDLDSPDFVTNGHVLSNLVRAEEKIRFSGDGGALQVAERRTYIPRLEFQIEYLGGEVRLLQTAPRLP